MKAFSKIIAMSLKYTGSGTVAPTYGVAIGINQAPGENYLLTMSGTANTTLTLIGAISNDQSEYFYGKNEYGGD